MIKNCHIFEDGRFGGPHQVFMNLQSQKITNMSNDVIFFREQSITFKKKLKFTKCSYFSINYFFLKRNNFIKYFLFIFRFYKILKKISKKNYDFYIIHNPNKSFVSIICLYFLKQKNIFYFHDNKTNFFLKKILSLLKFTTTGCIFSSHSSRKYYQEFSNKKNYVIHSSSNKLKFTKIHNKEFTIGTCANLSPVKNIIFFLKIANLFKDRKDIKFVILGNYWLTQTKYYKECIHFKQKNDLKNVDFYINHKNFKKIFSSFDLYLCTSFSESCPVSIIEAMSNGVPIISSNVGDVKKIINNKKNKCGEVLELNLLKFEESINKYKNDKKLYYKISKNCKNYFKKKFTNNVYSLNFKKIINDLYY